MKPLLLRCLLVFGLTSLLLSPVAAAEKRPNFLFILVDDQSPFDLKVYNPRSTLATPNIDALASRGIVIDGAYHMGAHVGAVCTPSRHMIMTGRTLWRLPIAPWAAKTCPPDIEQQTMPAVFNRAGYATMRTCKMGNSYEAANKLYQVRHDATKRGGTAETGSAWHAEQVLNYLAERKQSGDARPFLIDFGFSHPHDTRDGTPELLARYGAVNHTDKDNPPALNAKQPPLPLSYLPRHPFDNTDIKVRDEVSVSGVWQKRDEATIRNEIGRQNACSENIDIQIGRVLKKLEEMGELNNTYVIYSADHGMSIGRHGLQGKQNLYQHTWRVPFIVAGPGIPAGQRKEGNIYHYDTLATLCDYAGITPPDTSEGLSFRPLLEGKKATIRDVLYGVYCGGGKPGMRTVKQGDWKLVEYESPDRGAKETQLFNLRENPEEFLAEHHSAEVKSLSGANPSKEQTNLAKDPQYSVKLEELRTLLLAEMRRWDDPYRFSFQPADDLMPPPERARARARKESAPQTEN